MDLGMEVRRLVMVTTGISPFFLFLSRFFE